MDKVIEISNLKISFGKQEVLKNISLYLNKGENLIVFGKSGTGKSVLIKCIAKLLRPDSGIIKVYGKEINNYKSKEQTELQKQIGFLFQSGALYDSMTVKENLEFPLKRHEKNISKKKMNTKVMEALENVGLSDMLYKMPSELSGGMRKRIALARTIIVNPSIMLYDEPTTGLDPITSDEISELINKIQKKHNTSSIIITHDIACAKKIADRVIFLKDGKVGAEGTLQQLEHSGDQWIQSFLNTQ